MAETSWSYKKGSEITPSSLHIEVIADYGGGHSTDHAFSEVRNHFFRFDSAGFIHHLSEHPVYAFSTIETGFWIAQEGLHSEHKNLVIFSNTAPRGDIEWKGEHRQYFVCGMLDNGIPMFAVHAGYSLSFIKEHLTGLWEVVTPNVGTQFRSRDYYPEAAMAILNGDMNRIGKEIPLDTIPDVPKFRIGSVDGYGNLKTTIRVSEITGDLQSAPMLRVKMNGKSQFVLNTLSGHKGKTGDLCMVAGSSGGKNRNFIEFIRLHARAAEAWNIEGARDDLGEIIIEPVKG